MKVYSLPFALRFKIVVQCLKKFKIVVQGLKNEFGNCDTEGQGDKIGKWSSNLSVCLPTV